MIERAPSLAIPGVRTLVDERLLAGHCKCHIPNMVTNAVVALLTIEQANEWPLVLKDASKRNVYDARTWTTSVCLWLWTNYEVIELDCIMGCY